MSADKIGRLLEARHADDIYVPECNTGSAFAGCKRMDGWAMKKSWANPLTLGYEIKVSRQDFLRDDKWPNYLPFCNQLYFVVAHGIIDVSEVPETCGLIIASKNYKKLFTKKKAPHREIKDSDLNKIYKYVLMSCSEDRNGLSQKEVLRKWVEEKQNNDLHYLVSQKIRAIVDKVERENLSLTRENKKLQDIKKWAEDNQINLGSWHGVEHQLDKMNQLIDPVLKGQLKRFRDSINQIIEESERVTQ